MCIRDRVGDEAAYPMQSVVKFVLALSVLKRVDQGAMNLEQIIRIRCLLYTSGKGVSHGKKGGYQFSLMARNPIWRL